MLFTFTGYQRETASFPNRCPKSFPKGVQEMATKKAAPKTTKKAAKPAKSAKAKKATKSPKAKVAAKK